MFQEMFDGDPLILSVLRLAKWMCAVVGVFISIPCLPLLFSSEWWASGIVMVAVAIPFVHPVVHAYRGKTGHQMFWTLILVVNLIVSVSVYSVLPVLQLREAAIAWAVVYSVAALICVSVDRVMGPAAHSLSRFLATKM